ncbi:MAG: ATP-binding cassette domain-containing protein [Oscillospiraceae bacterium]|jgi:ABC-2 type transport system ATP-binding protein|nr:ATP-binding cassette domain-containing protein [Oscillospiraceae bacterium]
MSEVILSAEDMRKRYGKRILLDGFSLELRRGKAYGLIGAEKSGKSSALRGLLGLIKLDGGKVTWDIPRKFAGAAIDLPAFHRELSIRGNLQAQASLLKNKPDSGRISMLMEHLMIEEHFAGERSMRNLLTGQKQCAAIAMAMLGKPELLILDEPMSALDDECRKAFSDLFKEEYADKTALLTAQEASDLDGIVTDFIYIDGGRNAKG